MRQTRELEFRLAVIAVITVATLAFHYGFLLPAAGGGHHGGLLHAIHGRLCYIPIILGAIWFGVRGGLGLALGIALLTAPYPYVKGIHDRALLLNEYTEMVFYVAIGLTAGILIEQQRSERRRSDSLQRELAHKERLSSLGQMAAGLAHEIKNPLGSIQGAAEILGDDAGSDARRRDLLDVLNKESRRLGTVVDHFLSFARPRPLRTGTVRVNDVVEQTAAQIGLDASNRAVTIECDLDPSAPTIEADAEQLHQVFMNVLLNAIAASPEGGRVRVRTGGGDREVTVTVADDGVGIAPSDLPRVFDPFFTTKDSGTGLGLSVSHAIIEDHGGRIAIESELGSGTTVTITVPSIAGKEGPRGA
jgi:two-component system sensor histidine kinase HydH